MSRGRTENRMGRVKTWQPWEELEMLKMWADGRTLQELANHFGVSRSAAGGKLRRLQMAEETKKLNEALGIKGGKGAGAGLGGSGVRVSERGDKGKRRKKNEGRPGEGDTGILSGAAVERIRVARGKARGERSRKSYAFIVETIKKREAGEKIASEFPFVLDEYELGRLPGKPLGDVCGCRWPLTKEMPHMFCDAPRRAGKSYCEHHMEKAWGKGTQSEQSAVRNAATIARKEIKAYVEG